MKLDVERWKPFKIQRTKTQAGLFEIENCKCNCAGQLDDGLDINYIGAKKNDNGVMRSVALNEALISKGHGIMFICDGEGSVGYTNYIDKDFIGSTTTAIGYDEALTQLNAMFLISVLDNEKFRYSYGRKYRNHLGKMEIYLPAKHNPNGSIFKDKSKRYSKFGYVPDWEFMENYIKTLHYKPLTTKNRPENALALDTNKWGEFQVKDIFTFKNGKGLTTEEIEENAGDFAVVQSGEKNNGVIGLVDLNYCKFKNYVYTLKPCLAVAKNGSAGFVSFQKNGCVAGNDAKILLLPDKIAKVGIYLFLQTILSANRFKYSYGRKVTNEKYENEIIKLPINHKGEPDFEFMENYIKSLPYGDRV